MRGAILVAAVARYAMVSHALWRFDVPLAVLAAALIATTVLQQAVLRRAGEVEPVSLGGRRGPRTVAGWVACLLLAGAATTLGHALALVVYWVPTSVHAWFAGWSWPWVAATGTTIVATAYLYVVARITGVAQSFVAEYYSVTTTQQSGSLVNEHVSHHGEYIPRSRSGLDALYTVRLFTHYQEHSRTTGGGYLGSYYGAYSVTHTTTYRQVHLVEFPPRFQPPWFTRLADATRRAGSSYR